MTGIKSDSLQGVFQKGSLPETIAVHTVAKHVHFLRGDAWKDFEHLEQGTFSKAQFESIRRIREKAFARAEFYKNLKDFAPETGF